MSVLQYIKTRSFLVSVCVAFSGLMIGYWFLSSFTPSLQLALVSESGKVTLRFTNVGRNSLSLDTIGMEFFIFQPPDDSRKYQVIVQDKTAANTYEKKLRESSLTVLRPGEYVDVGNVSPFIQGLPRGNVDVSAVYSTDSESNHRADAWRGTVKSIPFLARVS